MKRQTLAMSASLMSTALLLVACGGGDGGEGEPTWQAGLNAEKQARIRAVNLVAGEYALVCQRIGATDEKLTLSIGTGGEIRLGSRPPLNATDRDATVLISNVAGSEQGTRQALNLSVSHANSEVTGRAINFAVNFTATGSGPLMLVDVQYERADQADWANCVAADVRDGPQQPNATAMASLIGLASESMMCTAGGTNVAARYQVELADSALTMANLTSTVHVDLRQDRNWEEIRYPSQSYAVTPSNTGQVHQAHLSDGSWFSVVRDRSGSVTEVSAGSGAPGGSLSCRK